MDTNCRLTCIHGKGRQNLGMHFLCFIEDSLSPGNFKVTPKMIIGPKLEKKLPKEGYEVRNLTPVTEDKDEIPDEPRHIGDGSKSRDIKIFFRAVYI